MTFHGTIVVIVIGFILLTWILHLVRRGRLYVGYALILIGSIALGLLLVSVPALLQTVTAIIGAVFPVSALTLAALSFIAVVLIHVLSQLTVLSQQMTQLVQELAIRGTHGSASSAKHSHQ